MKAEGRWILLVPVLCLAIGAWYFTADRSDVKVSFERAKSLWREGRFHEAVQAYLRIEQEYPTTRFAAESLWEAGTIYYYSLDDPANALVCFERVIRDYPSSRWVGASRLRLADIYELELDEPASALRWLNEALADPESARLRDEIEFRIGQIHFKLNEFGLAFEEFDRVARTQPQGSHLGHQARLRLGVIHQIRREHEAAISRLREVLADEPCGDCRLHAQLSLIESYEMLDRLPEAIEVARQIREDDYPDELRQQLLQRLLEKRKYYEPNLWGGL